MGKLIAIINSKGGVGKTTTAVLLANELSKYGTVQLKDADTQGSATSWIDRIDTELPFHFEITNKTQISRNRDNYDYTIIDTPPQDTMIMDAAIRCADYVIIPSSPTALDLERVFEVLSVVGKTKYKVLLTLVATNTRTYKAARTMLEDQGINLFGTDISHREAIKRSVGKIPNEPEATHDYELIAKEVVSEIRNEAN